MLTRRIAIALMIGGTLGGLALGFGAGWLLNGWRLAGELQELKGTVATQRQAIATLEGANGRCTASVAEVRGAVKDLVDENARRAAAAQAAIARAEKSAEKHLQAATAALARPAPKAGEECATLVREALDYARKRKGAAP